MVKGEIIYVFPEKILCKKVQKVGVNSRKGEFLYRLWLMTLLRLRPQYNKAEISIYQLLQAL